MDSLIVDCSTCQVRGVGCSDCVISVLLEPFDPQAVSEPQAVFDTDEQAAVAALVESGLVPPLRLVTPDRGSDGAGESPGPHRRAAGW